MPAPLNNVVLNATGDKTGFLTGAGQTGLTSIDLSVDWAHELGIDLNLTALTGGTSPSVAYTVNRKAPDGLYYTIFTGTALTSVGKQSVSLGMGSSVAAQNVSFGNYIQIVITVNGAPTTATWTLGIVGK